MAASTFEPMRRSRQRRRPRHVAPAPPDRFVGSLRALEFLALNGVTVSARIEDLASGRVLLSADDHIVMPTASIGTVLLLVETAALLRDDAGPSGRILRRETRDLVTDSGLWQHLRVPALEVADLATLVGATSDNVATNVLARVVGLDAVRRRGEALGLTRTAMLDRAREERGPDDAPNLSLGSMRELCGLFRALEHGQVIDPLTSRTVVDWLTNNVDLSLVSAAFGLDPLAHRDRNHELRLFNRVGSDPTVRAEVGVLRGPSGGVSYAVAAAFADTDLRTRLAVIDALRRIGLDVLEYVS